MIWAQHWAQVDLGLCPDRLSTRARRGTRTPTVLPTSTSILCENTRLPTTMVP